MKIKFSKFLSVSKIFPTGEMRYFLNGLETYTDLDDIIAVLKDNFGVKVVRDIFVMFFRRIELEKGEKKFILYWDEDIDIFFISSQKTEDAWLEQFVKEAIPFIEKYINEKK
jgi:hypothetical protein